MTLFEDAVKKDIQREVVAAAFAYENCILEVAPLDAFINLAFLYWQSTEYGFNAGYNLPSDFIHQAADRYLPILELGLSTFPNSKELVFWKRYFAYDSLGEEFSSVECEECIEEQEGKLVPYFYLRSLPGGIRYVDEANQLLQQCKSLLTFKNTYIISILESKASPQNLKVKVRHGPK